MIHIYLDDNCKRLARGRLGSRAGPMRGEAPRERTAVQVEFQSRIGGMSGTYQKGEGYENSQRFGQCHRGGWRGGVDRNFGLEGLGKGKGDQILV